jgi:hypothetical protein
VEIYGNRWSGLQLTTVAEDHPKGKQLLRCRLRTRWSLQAKVAFWALCGFELLVLGFVGAWLPWLWALLLTLPLFAWFLQREQRNLQALVTVFLDELAKDWKLVKFRSSSEPAPDNAVTPQPDPKSPFADSSPRPEPKAQPSEGVGAARAEA